MPTLLRLLGITAWIGCVLTLIYQSLTWVFTASWPSVTLSDALNVIPGVDLFTPTETLPLEYAMKVTYVMLTTQLSIALWWTGAALFGLTLGWKVILNK